MKKTSRQAGRQADLVMLLVALRVDQASWNPRLWVFMRKAMITEALREIPAPLGERKEWRGGMRPSHRGVGKDQRLTSGPRRRHYLH